MKRLIWVMPEERDEKFSNKLLKRFASLAKSLKVCAFSVEIEEQYQNEESPHYHIKVSSRQIDDSTIKVRILTWYSAIKDGEKFEGQMELTVQTTSPTVYSKILAGTLFGYYDEYIRKYYPEWTTHYSNIMF